MFTNSRAIVPMAKNLINLEYKLITPDRYKDLMFHLRDVCSQADPLNKTFCECIRKGGNEFVDYFMYKTLKDKMSLMAVNDQGQVVGAVLNGIAKPRDLYDFRHCIDSIIDPHLKNILQMQLEENMQHNIFHFCNVKKTFEIRLLSVDTRSYNGRILGKQLIRLSEILAAKKNHKVMKADATGKFSQKILSNCGFECLNEKYYNRYINKNNTDPLNVENTKYQLLFKLLH